MNGQAGYEARPPAIPRTKERRQIHPGPKSCQQCRKSKQRCDLPDRQSLQPSLQPQPAHLECHRCKVLKLPCVVEVALQTQSTPPQGDSPGKAALPSARKRSGSPMALPSRRPSVMESPTASSSSPRRYPQLNTRHPGEGAEAQRGVHLFDPHFEGKEYHLLPTPHRMAAAGRGDATDRFHSTSSSAGGSEQDVSATMGLLRPFPYFSRLCCLQPGFFAPPRVSTYECDVPLQEIINRHAGSIHWEEMNIHVQSFQLFLPFLERLQRSERSIESGGLWFAMSLYLASTRTDLIDLQADLLAFLRRHILSCLIRGPATIGEAAALVAVALYEPLLLAKSVDDMQLDGAGMLTSASAAAKSLGLDAVPSAMHAFDFRSGRSPTGLLRQCALYMTIALYSEYQSMMGNTRQRALLHSSDGQLQEIDAFCRRVLESSAFQHDAEQASLLLILLFRSRAARGFRLMCLDHCSMLKSQSDPLSAEGEQNLRHCIAETHGMANDVLSQLPGLRHGMALVQETFNMYLDYMEVEIEQLRMFNLYTIQDTCILLLTTVLEGKRTLPAVVQSILPNERALRFISIIGIPKTAACRKLAVLLSNFVDRWSDGEHRRTRRGAAAEEVGESTYARNYPLAPPPAYLCAAILPNIKSLCEGAAGSFHLASAAGNQLVEGDADLAVSLTRQFSQTLLRLTRTPQSQTLFLAKGHCDLLQMVARIARQTSLAIHDFTASCKGLRTNMSTPLKAGLPFIVRHDGDALSTLKPPNSASSTATATSTAKQEYDQRRGSTSSTDKGPSISVNNPMPSGPDSLNFEVLLQEILSTPIIMSG